MAGFELVFSLDCTCATLNTTFTLRGELDVSLVQPALVATSQSDADLKEQIGNNKALEQALEVIGDLPLLPKRLIIPAKILASDLKEKGKMDAEELNRRKQGR